jgi:hypothetical protein
MGLVDDLRVAGEQGIYDGVFDGVWFPSENKDLLSDSADRIDTLETALRANIEAAKYANRYGHTTAIAQLLTIEATSREALGDSS